MDTTGHNRSEIQSLANPFQLTLLRLAVRNLRRKALRSTLTALGIGLALLSALCLAAFARGLGAQLVEDSIYNLTGHVQVRNVHYSEDPAADFSFSLSEDQESSLQSLSSRAFLPRIRVPAFIRSERTTAAVTLVGVVPSREQGTDTKAGHSLAGKPTLHGEGLLDSDTNFIVLGQTLLEDLETNIGKRVVLSTETPNGELGERSFRIKGTFESDLEQTERFFAFLPLKDAQMLTSLSGQLSEISIVSKEDPSVLMNQVQSIFPEEKVTTWRELEPLVDSMVSLQDQLLLFWFSLVLVAAGFSLVNTLSMTIHERKTEITLLRSLGMSLLKVRLQFFIECMLLVVSGLVIGMTSFLLLFSAFQSGIDLTSFSAGTAKVGLRSTVVPVLLWRDVFQVIGILSIVALVGALFSIIRGARAKQPLGSGMLHVAS